MIRSLNLLLTVLFLTLVSLGTARAGHPPKASITIAAASDLAFSLPTIVERFEKQNPDAEIKVTYGSSGNFHAQLLRGAPFDVFLSADLDYPRELSSRGLADEIKTGSVFVYGEGRLVVWTKRGSGIPIETEGLKALTNPKVRKIAIANPRHAPYGRAARTVLEKVGIWNELQPKLVIAENVAQAAQFAQSGAAEVALIALALATSPKLSSEGVFSEIEGTLAPRLEQGGIVLAKSSQKQLAHRFREFLCSSEGKGLLKSGGILARP